MYPPADSDTEEANTRRQNTLCSEMSSTQCNHMNDTDTWCYTSEKLCRNSEEMKCHHCQNLTKTNQVKQYTLQIYTFTLVFNDLFHEMSK